MPERIFTAFRDVRGQPAAGMPVIETKADVSLTDKKTISRQMKSVLIYSILLFSALQASAQATREIFFADVTIYVEGGRYYLTGSKGGGDGPQGFAFLESKDLKTWAVPARSKDSLGMILTKGDHTFGTKGFWAPQIFKDKGTSIVHRSIVGENGSGHGDLFEGTDHQLYYVYHIHNSSDKVSPRRTRIVPVVKQWDEKAGVYTFSVKGKEVIVPVLAEN